MSAPVSLTNVLAALADPTRLRIVTLLAQDEVCVCHIHESLGIPQSKASRHLAYLRRSGIVKANKRGLWVYYRVATLEDRASATVLAATRDAFSGADQARRDARRLAKTICCVPAGPRAALVPTKGRSRSRAASANPVRRRPV